MAILLVFALAQLGGLPPLDALALAALQGLCASFLSLLSKADRWWLPLHLVFFPGIVLASQLHLPPQLYGLVFIGLLCVYWTVFRTRVPLFLSNRASVHRLAMALPNAPAQRVLDVGSGTGSFVVRLAALRPDWHISGCELAPAPYFASRWRARKYSNLRMLRQDFWTRSFADYDVVYAFLSPAPMDDLWRKAKREMRPGTLLVSNSFDIPGLNPERIIAVGDRRDTQLFCYRIPASGR